MYCDLNNMMLPQPDYIPTATDIQHEMPMYNTAPMYQYMDGMVQLDNYEEPLMKTEGYKRPPDIREEQQARFDLLKSTYYDQQVNQPTNSVLPRSNEHIVNNPSKWYVPFIDPQNHEIYNPSSAIYGMTENQYWNVEIDNYQYTPWDTNTNLRMLDPEFIGLFQDVMQRMENYKIKNQQPPE